MAKKIPDVTGANVRPGGGDGRETRDAQDDAAIRSAVEGTEHNTAELLAAMSGWEGRYPPPPGDDSNAPVTYERGPVFPPEEANGSGPPPIPSAPERPAPPPIPEVPPEAIGRSRAEAVPPEANPAPGAPPRKPHDAREDERNPSNSSGLMSKVDETNRLLELIRKALEERQPARVAAGQPADGSSPARPQWSSPAPADDKGQPGWPVNALPNPQSGAPAGPSGDLPPGYGYGARVYPWTHWTGFFESVGRNGAEAANGVFPGFRQAAGRIAQATTDFSAMTRPFRDIDPYEILRNNADLRDRIKDVKSELSNLYKARPTDDSPDDVKERYAQKVRGKVSDLVGMEAAEKSQADSVAWAKAVSDRFTEIPVLGKFATAIASKVVAPELAGSAAATATAATVGFAVAAPVAAIQMARAANDFMEGMHANAYQTLKSQARFGYGPTMGELASFNIGERLRELRVGMNTEGSSRELIRFGNEVEWRSIGARTADARLGNYAAIAQYQLYDSWLRVRRPFDDLVNSLDEKKTSDAIRMTMNAAFNATGIGALSKLYELLAGKAPEVDKAPPDPWGDWGRKFSEMPRLAPRIPEFGPPPKGFS